MEVTDNGANFSAVSVEFLLYADIAIVRVQPSRVQESTSQAVTIIGKNFLDSSTLIAKVGKEYIPAFWQTTSSVKITAPASLPPGAHSVFVSNNGIDLSFGSVEISVDPAPDLVLVPSIGLVTGGITITVKGLTSMSRRTRYCSFDGNKAKADSCNSKSCLCLLPIGIVGEAKFTLTENDDKGNENVVGSSRFEFLPSSPFALIGIHPTFGPVTGGTKITVTGGEFSRTSALNCTFENTVSGRATILSSSLVLCTTPSHDVGSTDFAIFSQTLGRSESAERFDFVKTWSVSSLSPSLIMDLVDKSVTVSGSDFIESELLRCRIGSKFSADVQFVSSNEINCKVPHVGVGNFTVEISCNGQDFSRQSASLESHLFGWKRSRQLQTIKLDIYIYIYIYIHI